jgi:hypothetical protein
LKKTTGKKTTGKKVVFSKVSDQMFADHMKTTGSFNEQFLDYCKCIEEFSYFGPEGEKAVRLGNKGLEGVLTGYEKHLVSFPLVLE